MGISSAQHTIYCCVTVKVLFDESYEACPEIKDNKGLKHVQNF